MSLSTSRIVAPTLSTLIVAGSACTEHTAPAYSTLIVVT